MKYCRINLEEGDYDSIDYEIEQFPDIDLLLKIYDEYCEYKGFDSVMPLFRSEFRDDTVDVITYKINDEIVAFSLNKIHDSENIESIQFAWNYKNPKSRLGIRSLISECSHYKKLGYKYFYLGEAMEYKRIDGYEEL